MTTLTQQDERADLLRRSRRIAVVGFSTNPAKPSHSAPMVLVRRGWDVIPIHPTASEVAGLRAARSLADVDGRIDLVDIFRPAAETPAIVQQAIEVGAGAVWLQLGIASDEARALAEDAGIPYVEDACAGAMARRLDLHPDGSS